MNKSIDINNLEIAIGDILRGYGDLVYKATEEALTAGEKVLISNLRKASPKLTGKYAKSWKSKGKKYKLRRFIGNTKSVETKTKKSTTEMPLSNILEYSSTSKYQGLIKRTYEESVNEIARTIVNEIKKEV